MQICALISGWDLSTAAFHRSETHSPVFFGGLVPENRQWRTYKIDTFLLLRHGRHGSRGTQTIWKSDKHCNILPRSFASFRLDGGSSEDVVDRYLLTDLGRLM